MKVQTESGSIYDLWSDVESNGLPLLLARKEGWPILEMEGVTAVYPPGLPALMRTRSMRSSPYSGLYEGLTRKGERTFLFDPYEVRRGMILANIRGIRSTKIVMIVDGGPGWEKRNVIPCDFKFLQWRQSY